MFRKSVIIVSKFWKQEMEGSKEGSHVLRTAIVSEDGEWPCGSGPAVHCSVPSTEEDQSWQLGPRTGAR